MVFINVADVRSPMSKKKAKMIKAVVADAQGKIFDLDGYAAVGMAGSWKIVLDSENAISMPYGSEMMFLPDRYPIVYHIRRKRIETLYENPFFPGEPVFPVAVFNSPGYVLDKTCAYEEHKKETGFLPLFSYGAIGWYQGKFVSSAVRVEWERRQDLRLMKEEKILEGIQAMRREMPDNRLREHLERCALVYRCPAGKNFFLRRYEAPLPTSTTCNARCLGCISFQSGSGIPASQNRISFKPSAEEIAEVAIAHIRRVKKAVVSFGQGCEGEPLLAADVMLPAVRMIRRQTSEGTIHINTNASKPDVLEGLFAAGIDSIRVSMNSVQKKCYEAYFRPVSYSFEDVLKSIEVAEKFNRFVSINYLNCPGFTDSPEEMAVLFQFLKENTIHMIQWRNLNFDPSRYYKIMQKVSPMTQPIGMKNLLQKIRNDFPHIRFGYFNPPKEKFFQSKF